MTQVELMRMHSIGVGHSLSRPSSCMISASLFRDRDAGLGGLYGADWRPADVCAVQLCHTRRPTAVDHPARLRRSPLALINRIITCLCVILAPRAEYRTTTP